MKLKSFKNLSLKDEKVLLRVNFDLPISAEGGSASGGKNGKILDDSRIKAHLPTIFYLIKKKAKVILISHLGDPQKIKNINPKLAHLGRRRKRIKKYSLKPVAEYINNFQFPISSFQTNSKSQIPKLKVKFIKETIGPEVKKEIDKLRPGKVILLENLRFYPGEEKNDKNFAKSLASLANLYINDAFPTCHRAHASISGITKYLPSYAGLLLEKEVENLSQVLERPRHPFVVLLGGAKISTKLPVIKNLVGKVDKILIGGALANTFFAAKKLNIGKSIYGEKMVEEAEKLLKNEKVVLPVDAVIEIKNKRKKIKVNQLNDLRKGNFKILDISEKTLKLFSEYLRSAKMIVWNGPMGLFEEKPFDKGTRKIIQVILKNKKAKIFIGGGDTLAALQQARISADKVRIDADISVNQRKSAHVFISTGGGAMLEFLSGKILPGIKPLLK